MIGIVEVLNDDEVKKVEQGVYDCVHLWKPRVNWHPVNDVPQYNEDIETLCTTVHWVLPCTWMHLTWGGNTMRSIETLPTEYLI